MRAGKEDKIIWDRTDLFESWLIAQRLAAKPESDELKRTDIQDKFNVIDTEFKSIPSLRAFIHVIARFELEASARIRLQTLLALPPVPHSHEACCITPVASTGTVSVATHCARLRLTAITS